MRNLLPLPTYQGSLATFIGELRDLVFSSQQKAADHFHLHRSRVTRYEDFAAKDKPPIGYLAGLARLIVEERGNAPELQDALLQEVNKILPSRHYRKHCFQNWEALRSAADIYQAKQRAKRPARPSSEAEHSEDRWQDKLRDRLDLPPDAQLTGVEEILEQLLEVLGGEKPQFLLSIEGLGGLGKTAVTNALIRQPELGKRFQDLVWVNAKQQDFFPGLGLIDTGQAVLSPESLIDALLEQLDSSFSLARPLLQKKIALRRLLSKKPYLIVIDNLETVRDYEVLLPDLRKLANPGKIILTSRSSLRAHADVFCLQLNELTPAAALQLIKREAETRGLRALLKASRANLIRIIDVVGGNPLAIKLVVGQIAVLSLSQTLENLKQAQNKESAELYTHIYWQTWHLLNENARRIFLIMPLAQGGGIEQLMALSGMSLPELNQALQQLVKFSLLQVSATLEDRRYTIHRLTETFLLNEAIQWKASL